MNEPSRHLFARDGHLTMLSLDRYDTDELDDSARRCLELHVEHCDGCRTRLHAVQAPTAAILPRVVAGRSTGSASIAYLAATATLALAASAVLGLGSSLVPSPRAVHETPIEPSHNASAYTSVAQEYSEDPGLQLELAMRGESLVATPDGDGYLAIVVVTQDAAVDVEDEPEIVDVVYAARPVSESVRVAVPRRLADARIVALFCPAPFTVERGDAFATDPGCIVRERGE